jgi:cysteine synthase
LCLVDPEASVFHRHLADRNVTIWSGERSIVEGIGRPRCEPSFMPDLIDRAYAAPDAASIAAARVLSRRIGRSCGGSTGTNLWAVAQIAAEMAQRGEQGSIVTLLCDSGERYRSTHLDDSWLAARGLDIRPAEAAIEAFFETGRFEALPTRVAF